MSNSKSYLFYGIILLAMLFIFITLARVRQPLEEIAKLPRCENNVIVSEELKSSVIRYSNNHIKNAVGEDYFYNHYHFLKLDFSTEECIFLVTYSYSYDKIHASMNLRLIAYSNRDFEVTDVNAFLRPVEILIPEEEAVEIAEQQEVSYDFYNIEPNLLRQTFVYSFYRRTITEGQELVFEVDAQSGEIRTFEKMLRTAPLV